MPLYEYECEAGHRQQRLRAIAVRDDAVDCDCCGAPASRTVVAPRLAVMSSLNRRAHERNERSAHEPRRHTRTAPVEHAPKKTSHACSHGHAHAHHGRPWMLGH